MHPPIPPPQGNRLTPNWTTKPTLFSTAIALCLSKVQNRIELELKNNPVAQPTCPVSPPSHKLKLRKNKNY
ncbi:MAG: hypothetical protein RLP02_25755 [Coleofasciculus sp. C2-GNP5-27]